MSEAFVEPARINWEYIIDQLEHARTVVGKRKLDSYSNYDKVFQQGRLDVLSAAKFSAEQYRDTMPETEEGYIDSAIATDARRENHLIPVGNIAFTLFAHDFQDILESFQPPKEMLEEYHSRYTQSVHAALYEWSGGAWSIYDYPGTQDYPHWLQEKWHDVQDKLWAEHQRKWQEPNSSPSRHTTY